jgi:alpha-N-acetylglucosamine transferase
MKKNAIVTLNVGKKWDVKFKFHFLPSWERYCQRHGIHLVNLTRNLDDSVRAASRSPSWQKLLVHLAPELQEYERIAWVDSDVLIRADAPNIFDASPIDKVGAVDDFGTPNREDHDLMMDTLYKKWDAEKIRYISNRTPEEYYKNYGINCNLDSVVQAGVMVYTPEIHGKLFNMVYQNYEEGESPALNHEMRPLSYELLSAGLVHWISPKFNMQWSYYRQLYYPFLDNEEEYELLKWPKISTYKKVLTASVNTAFRNNYFLHFAGGSKDYQFIAKAS